MQFFLVQNKKKPGTQYCFTRNTLLTGIIQRDKYVHTYLKEVMYFKIMKSKYKEDGGIG